jgi:hypothetical protein
MATKWKRCFLEKTLLKKKHSGVMAILPVA